MSVFKCKMCGDNNEFEQGKTVGAVAAKKRKRIIPVAATIAVACIALTIVVIKVIIPAHNYNSALKLMEAAKYEEAIAAFEALNGYKDSAAKIEECNTGIKDIAYNEAVELMEEGAYEEAITRFEALDGYRDSASKIEECNTGIKDIAYNEAVELMEEGAYEEAITRFEALNGYKDSAAKIEECNTGIKDIAYNKAIELIESGSYDDAIVSLDALDDYKDSSEKLIEICTSSVYLKSKEPGDKIVFGAYEQDNNTSNGKELIKWRVLAKEDNKMLLISDNALDSVPYNADNMDVTWETCTLRGWLNNDFYKEAFCEEERELIQSTTVTAEQHPNFPADPGNNTNDKVFILSIGETEKYFMSNDDRMCVPTEYAISNGAGISSKYSVEGNPTCWWWLRTPCEDNVYTSCVNVFGYAYSEFYVVGYSGGGIRPAIWISLDR